MIIVQNAAAADVHKEQTKNINIKSVIFNKKENLKQ
jgi:hypothetical protein